MPRKSLDEQTLDEALEEWAEAVLLADGCDGDNEGARALAQEILHGRDAARTEAPHVG